MFSWFKKHFIPHEGNDHRPYLLRDENMRVLLIIIILLEIFFFLIPTLTRINQTGDMAAVLPAVLTSLANDERQAQYLAILRVNPILNEAAQLKAQDMATKGYFAHISPEGKTPWYWIEKVGYKYKYAGENLAVNFSDSKDVALAWMNSPTHKANIVKGNYTEIGTGVASGIYQGRETIFVAQVYANPLPTNLIRNLTSITKAEKIEPGNKTATSSVLGAEIDESTNVVKNIAIRQIVEPTLWQRLLASPRDTTNKIFGLIFAIIGIGLLLYIFIKMRNHHADLVTNGLIVLALIGAILLVNYYFSQRNMEISTDYSMAYQ